MPTHRINRKIKKLQEELAVANGINRRSTEYATDLDTALYNERKAIAAKNEFIANTSHEIRTPMNSIVGYSELVLDDNSLSEETRAYINKIVVNARWLLNIVDDIMDYSQIEAGKLEIENKPFDIVSMLEHCKQTIMPDALAKGLDVEFLIDSFLEAQLIGDRSRLTQVCLNLLSNAVKFTEEGKIICDVKKIDQNKDVYTIQFSIIDTGIGMEHVDNVFEPFTQADGSTTRKYGGTGLGLAICERIVSQMGGSFEVISMVGVGTEFKFTIDFPTILWIDYDFGHGNVHGYFPVKPYFNNERILVVEDNEMNQGVITEHLKRVGITPMIAENGKEAIEIVQSEISRLKTNKPFGLIFMDINMPIMDGKETTVALKTMGVKTPIVAMTANTLTADAQVHKTYGMEGAIIKPFTSEQLWEVLLKYFSPIDYSSDDDMADDTAFITKMSLDFIKKYSNLYEEMYKNATHGKMDEAYRLAHNLKSNAGYIKRTKLQTIGTRLENAFRAGVIDSGLLEDLRVELDKTIKEINPILKGEEGYLGDTAKASNEKISVEEALEILDNLEVMLSENNMSSMMYIDKLYAIPNTEELIEKVDDLEFEEALKILKALKIEIQA